MKKKSFWGGVTIIILAIIMGVFIAKRPEQQEDRVIKIGVILPLTGPASAPTKNLLNGLKLSGLPNEDKVRLYIDDSKASSKEGLTIYNKLVNLNNMDLFIVGLSSVILPIVPRLSKDKKIAIATLSNYPDLANKSRYLFRFFINSMDEAKILSQYLETLHVRRLSIIHINDDAGIGVANALKQGFQGETTNMESYDRGKQDFRDIVIKVKSWEADVIAVIGYGRSLGILISQLREAGVSKPLVSTSPLGSADARSAAGNAMFSDIYYIAPFFNFSTDSLSAYFRTLYYNNYQEHPDFLAAYGYDLGKLLLALINKIERFNTKAFIEGLQKSDRMGVTGHIVVDEQGEIKAPLVVVRYTETGEKIVYGGAKNEKQ